MNEDILRLLEEHFFYEPQAGHIYWKKSPNRRIEAWSHAGDINQKGYARVRIKGRIFAAHRVAWFLHYGVWPEGILDHANCDKTDNRIENLRIATPSQNGANRHGLRDGLKGAYWSRRGGCWCSRIRAHGRLVHLGSFPTEKQAHAAYCSAAKQYYGEFARFE